MNAKRGRVVHQYENHLQDWIDGAARGDRPFGAQLIGGVRLLSAVTNAELVVSHQIKNTVFCWWKAINESRRRIKIRIDSSPDGGLIAWTPRSNQHVVVEGVRATVRGTLIETRRADRYYRYGSWTQPFNVHETGDEKIASSMAEQAIDSHFMVFADRVKSTDTASAQETKGRESKENEHSDSKKDENVTKRRRVFLSHVGEDKEAIVRPFAEALERERISYWLDEAEILWGENLIAKINEGLATSDFVVCFISNKFLERKWPKAELDAAMSEEIGGGKNRVLPVLLADKEACFAQYPLLRTKLSKEWVPGKIEELIAELKRVITKAAGRKS